MRDLRLSKAINEFCDVNSVPKKDLVKLSKVAKITSGFIFSLVDSTGSLDENSAKISIYRATLDITARTLKKKADSPTNGYIDLSNKIASKGLLSQLKEWFDKPIYTLTDDSYNDWHHKTCDLVLPVIRDMYTNKDGTPVSYGKAQKIVNMTMKHLYCLNNSDLKEEYFVPCHMPIDSFTLKWLKRQNEHVEENKKLPAWSNLEFEYKENNNKYYTYTEIVELMNAAAKINIGQFSDCSSYTPLQTEFIIWPEIQRIEALEAFLYKFQNNIVENEEDAESGKEEKNPKMVELQKIKLKDKYILASELLKEFAKQQN